VQHPHRADTQVDEDLRIEANLVVYQLDADCAEVAARLIAVIKVLKQLDVTA
jgi:hypothetical protein